MRILVRGRIVVVIVLAAGMLAGIMWLGTSLSNRILPPGPPAAQTTVPPSRPQAAPESAAVAPQPATPPAGPARAPCPSDQRWGAFGADGFGPYPYAPVFAPSGCEIAFVGAGDRVDEVRIWIVAVDGSYLRRIITDARLDLFSAKLAWSPDGTRIAFASGAGDIWLVGPDGSHPAQLTTDQAKDLMPAWSPDGSQIAFVSDRTGTGEIWIMNADGTDPRMVTDLRLPRGVRDPAFSPDGRQLVFARSEVMPSASGTAWRSHLAIVNVDGTDLRQLTAGDARDGRPQWSASGIVFESDRTGLPNAHYTALWFVQADGSGLRALPNGYGEKPSWSADGTKIVYEGEDINVLDLSSGTVQPVVMPRVFLAVIQIRPGRTNTIGLRAERTIAVAILSTPWLDPVRQIDRASITFGPTGDEHRAASCTEQEVNQDGVLDLVCEFDIAGFLPRHTTGVLHAIDHDGTRFEGQDAVRVLP